MEHRFDRSLILLREIVDEQPASRAVSICNRVSPRPDRRCQQLVQIFPLLVSENATVRVSVRGHLFTQPFSPLPIPLQTEPPPRSIRVIPFGNPHEYVFQVDRFLAQHLEAEAVVDQGLRDEAAVLDAVAQRHQQEIVLRPCARSSSTLDCLSRAGLASALRPSPTHDRHARALADLLDGGLHVAVEEQLAALDDADLVADVGQLRQDVAGEHDRLAHVAQLLDQAAHSMRARIEAAGRLVEQQHLRLVQEDAGQAEPLRHAARQAGDQGVALVAEIDQVEHLLAFLAAFRPLDAIGGGEEFEILDHLHVVVDAEEVGHVADDAANVLGAVVDRVAAHGRLAPSWGEECRCSYASSEPQNLPICNDNDGQILENRVDGD